MLMIRRSIVLAAITTLALFGAAGRANAVNLWNTNAVGTGTGGIINNVDGLTISAVGCTVKLGGTNVNAANGGCSLLNLQMTATARRGVVTVTITGASSAPIFSTANVLTGAGGTKYTEANGLNDLTLTLNVTAAANPVSTLGATLTGSTSGSGSASTKASDLTDLTLGESLNGGVKKTGTGTETGALDNSGGTVGLSLSSLASGVYSGTVSGTFVCGSNCQSGTTFAPMTSFQVVKDMQLNSPVGGVDTLQLSSITEIFNTPEPASIGLMIVGLGGLIGVRRFRRARS